MSDKNYIRVGNPDRNIEILSTEVLSADNIKYIGLDDGKRVEILVQKIDKKTGMLASRSRSLEPEIVENTIVRDAPEEQVSSLDTANPTSYISEEERQEIIAQKAAAKEEKLARAEENIRVANLDEDDEKSEEKKSESQRELEKAVIERNQEAAKNVTEVLNLKAELKAQGKSTKEIKDATNALKADQKKRGRPAAESLKNPVKDPVTGEFVESED